MPEAAAEWTIGRLIEWTRAFFEKKGIPQPRLEAEILLAHVLGTQRIDLYLRYEQAVGDAERAAFRELVRRRAERQPTRYLVGTCEFMSLAMAVTPDCLIPRPETELLVEEALRLAGVGGRLPGAAVLPSAQGAARGGRDARPDARPLLEPLTAIDLCTGCGCIAVSLAAHVPAMTVTATDISAAAVEVARRNAEAHGVADRVKFLVGDLYDALDAAGAEPADFILANPPYVSEQAWEALAPEIRLHEPRQALVAGPTGTEVIARVLRGAPAYLKPGGTLLVEIGAEQGPAVVAMASAVRGLADVRLMKDYAGLDRILVASRPPKR